MLEEFRKFGMCGNGIDTAAGIVTGAAFGKFVTSFVNDGLMPPRGKLMGGMDFSKPFINPGSEACPSLAAARESGAATLNYGIFIHTVVDFLIVAFAICMPVKAMNRLKTGEPARAPVTRSYPQPVRDTGCGKALQVLRTIA